MGVWSQAPTLFVGQVANRFAELLPATSNENGALAHSSSRRSPGSLWPARCGQVIPSSVVGVTWKWKPGNGEPSKEQMGGT